MIESVGDGIFVPHFAFKPKCGVLYLENEEILSTDTVEETEEQEEVKDFRHSIIEWMEVIVSALVAVVIIFTFFVRIATIDGSSMNNTLLHGEKVLISNIAYTPKQGDIVVISRNYNSVDPSQIDWTQNRDKSEPIIKRIIATEGQEVYIDFDKGIVYVDGKALDEPYISTPTTSKHDVDFPQTVPEGCVFVLGDNRQNSMDSRFKEIGNSGDGMIREEYIIGRVLLRILPFDKIGGID